MNQTYRVAFRQLVLERASGLNSTTAIPHLSLAEWRELADRPITIEQLALLLTSRFKGELHELRMKLRSAMP